ncbi:MAG: glucosamine-6-phosphate deaminase [Bacteroidia bacterium]|nr:glucosamine-6-phosphate deaminase [Bacteroidia bacterium]
MNIYTLDSPLALGGTAAKYAGEKIAAALAAQGYANIILATGASQFEVLRHLAIAESIDWSKVTIFHLDEYIGLPASHPASFRKYLSERFISQIPEPRAVHFVQGDAPDSQAECDRVGKLILSHPIDVALIGIGENGHLAFNDPPADFETEQPFIVVQLDEACRRQQLGEGWFPDFDAVPDKAISMSIRQILKSRCLIVSVPDERKAIAVKNAVNGPLSPHCPASILRAHDNCHIFLDHLSSSLL